MRASLHAAAAALRSANRIVLAAHVNPDGDALGSALALTLALRRMGKTAVPLSHDGVPEIYRWMPGQEWVLPETAERGFDLGILCDTGTLDRVGRARPALESAALTLCIDHHAAEGSFGRLRLVNPKSASTGEIVYSLLRTLGASIDRQIADCLMTAIVTDTGGFRFLNTTPATFRIAGELARYGASPAAVSELVFESRSFASIQLLGRALASLHLEADGRIAWAEVRAADFAELHASDEDTEGIVTHVRAIRGVKVGVLFREIPGKKIRVSLRAREGCDVNAVAAKFGGGGHKLAAGCSLDPPLDRARRLLLDEVERIVG